MGPQAPWASSWPGSLLLALSWVVSAKGRGEGRRCCEGGFMTTFPGCIRGSLEREAGWVLSGLWPPSFQVPARAAQGVLQHLPGGDECIAVNTHLCFLPPTHLSVLPTFHASATHPRSRAPSHLSTHPLISPSSHAFHAPARIAVHPPVHPSTHLPSICLIQHVSAVYQPNRPCVETSLRPHSP